MDYREPKSVKASIPFLQRRSKKQQWFRDLDKGISIQLPEELKLCVRWMNVQDILPVYALECQIFPSPWSVENFLYEIDNRDFNISLLGLINGQVVTYSISYIALDEFHISNLAVASDFRRLKIGETMLRITLQIGRETNCQVSHLEVRRSNEAAIALYQKYGFQVVGVRKKYYLNENEDALLMTKKLAGENIYGMV